VKHTLAFHLIGLAKGAEKIIGFKKSPLSLTYSQASALLIIKAYKNINQKEIATKLHLEPATIVAIIDELENMKFVKRCELDGDRRKYCINLTSHGEAKVKQIKIITSQIDKILRSELSEKEVEIFHKIVHKLSFHLDNWEGGENAIPRTKRHLAA